MYLNTFVGEKTILDHVHACECVLHEEVIWTDIEYMLCQMVGGGCVWEEKQEEGGVREEKRRRPSFHAYMCRLYCMFFTQIILEWIEYLGKVRIYTLDTCYSTLLMISPILHTDTNTFFQGSVSTKSTHCSKQHVTAHLKWKTGPVFKGVTNTSQTSRSWSQRRHRSPRVNLGFLWSSLHIQCQCQQLWNCLYTDARVLDDNCLAAALWGWSWVLLSPRWLILCVWSAQSGNAGHSRN